MSQRHITKRKTKQEKKIDKKIWRKVREHDMAPFFFSRRWDQTVRKWQQDSVIQCAIAFQISRGETACSNNISHRINCYFHTIRSMGWNTSEKRESWMPFGVTMWGWRLPWENSYPFRLCNRTHFSSTFRRLWLEFDCTLRSENFKHSNMAKWLLNRTKRSTMKSTIRTFSSPFYIESMSHFYQREITKSSSLFAFRWERARAMAKVEDKARADNLNAYQS